jgi:hypothetical protein
VSGSKLPGWRFCWEIGMVRIAEKKSRPEVGLPWVCKRGDLRFFGTKF